MKEAKKGKIASRDDVLFALSAVVGVLHDTNPEIAQKMARVIITDQPKRTDVKALVKAIAKRK